MKNHDEKYLLSDQQRRGYKTNSFTGRGQIFHIIDKLFTKFYYIKKVRIQLTDISQPSLLCALNLNSKHQNPD